MLSTKSILSRSNQHNEAKVEALFASIGEGLIVTDETGIITRVNKPALSIFGYKKYELLKHRFTEKIVEVYENGQPLNVLDRPIGKAFMTGHVVTEKTMYQRKDNSLVSVQVTVSPLLLRGKPIGTVQLFRDISSEIETEKMKSDFISLASHQLRTPLSSINIYAGMLLDGMGGNLNRKQKTFVLTILSSSHRMNELIDTLLNITRIEAGHIHVKAIKVDMRKLLDEIVIETTPSIKDKKIRFNFNTPQTPIMIKTDPLLVKEVFTNLLSNSVKYTKIGGTISIEIKNETKNYIFCFRDTGAGIPKKLQARVFTKFFRADNILTHDVSGTGLGLYLAKAIADNLSGDLWFESIENKGSTFYFSLPKHGSISRQGRFIIGL